MNKIIFIFMLMLIAGNLTAQGLTKYGELTGSSSNFVDKNGKIGNTPALNASGAVRTGPAVGDSYGGGIVAYILISTDPGYDASLIKGLIVTNSDQSTSAEWGCSGTTLSGADGSAIGTGLQNTIDIMAAPGGCATAGIAARLCRGVTINGYSDWYLPSLNEIKKLYANRVAIGDFSYGYYWSSTEENNNLAYTYHLVNGTQGGAAKLGSFYVRAIRSFTIGELTAIAAISGTPYVSSILTAGALTPTGASATYQWTICSTVGGTYTNIPTATSSTYTPVEADLGKFIKVVATGSDGCTGTVTSAATSAVSLTIGSSFGGGKVAYFLQSGDPGYVANIQKGLIAATEDQSTGIFWHVTDDGAPGATATAIGTGNANTSTICTSYGTESNAARICYDLELGGYTDWYLPSIDELAKLYANRTAIGNFTDSDYWSSSNYDGVSAWNLMFDGGSAGSLNKRYTNRVRAVRSFAIYPSVIIGTQTWTTVNLEVSTYRNGTPIRYAGTKADWEDAAVDKEGAWCYYANTEGNNATYGKLYNWYAVSDARGLAPAGWHVPSEPEWTTLSSSLGSDPGAKLKEAGTAHWTPPNTGATNSSGFSALPGGYRFEDGAFDYFGTDGFWWSSTQYEPADAWSRNLNYFNSLLSGDFYDKTRGFSVRCIKD